MSVFLHLFFFIIVSVFEFSLNPKVFQLLKCCLLVVENDDGFIVRSQECDGKQIIVICDADSRGATRYEFTKMRNSIIHWLLEEFVVCGIDDYRCIDIVHDPVRTTR